MSQEDRRKWDKKHAAGLAAGATPRSAVPFLEWLGPDLPTGRRGLRALDVASGAGAAALTLAALGYTVDAVDISLVALGQLREAASAARLARAVHTIVCDLDDGLPPDLGQYDLVVCTHYHAPHLWPALRGVLAVGGVLAIETLTKVNADRGLPGPSARFLVAPGQLKAAAAGLEILRFEEGLIDGRERARLSARCLSH